MTAEAVSAALSTSTEIASCKLPVRDMTCAACVRRVERALSKVPGVEDADVNFVTQRATVRFDPSRANRETLARAVEEAGYEVPRPKAVALPSATRER